ncbi:hypothetical protein Z042_06300 [Chania multitudinisentens RB-25]|uniref:Fimbrial-type adhesion domain-containing protein n=2 Tax=Chania TaxID=1745211 RepID=W0L6B2_9GAMM|nr:hypothetical protein Z042_06300 [Chania multitudinisentens RB-25]
MAVASMGISYSVLADAQLKISGTVKASPCNVDAVGGEVNVNLGNDIQAASLTAGNGSPWKQFTLHLVDCPTSTTSVTATFSGTPEPGSPTLYKNTGDATGVQIELQSTDTATPGKNLGNGQDAVAQVVTATRDATFPLQARAYSTNSNAAPGSIVGTIQVAFEYH